MNNSEGWCGVVWWLVEASARSGRCCWVRAEKACRNRTARTRRGGGPGGRAKGWETGREAAHTEARAKRGRRNSPCVGVNRGPGRRVLTTPEIGRVKFFWGGLVFCWDNCFLCGKKRFEYGTAQLTGTEFGSATEESDVIRVLRGLGCKVR